MWASAEADCHIIIFCKASIQEACQSQSNCETLCRQYDCVGVHQEDTRNLFLLPLYQRSQTLVQILSKKGNGKTTIWVNFRRKSGSKMRFCYTLCFEGFGCKLSVFTTLDAFASQRCHLFSYISPCYQNCSHQRNDRLLLFNCISKAFYFTQPH